MDRRTFLLGLALSPALMHCQRSTPTQFGGALLGPNHVAGHQLRQADFPAFSSTRRTKVAIVGAGVSGLAAGWYLQKHQMDDVALLELEAEVGGNARSGKNTISAYPWGAHYLPLPNHDNVLLKQFLAETGAITANVDSHRPLYQEHYLCFAPQERLFIHGQWQEGLRPDHGLSHRERTEIQAFEKQMQVFREATGRDNKSAFTIPLAASSHDPQFTMLDSITMAEYLHGQGWHSAPLHWYVNYACRDDYGMPHTSISAWAGIHYFASRRGQAANADTDQVLTWPQGNAWLTQQLANPQQDAIHTRQLVHAIQLEAHHVTVDVYDLTTQQTTRWIADHVIYASPLNTLPYVLRNDPSLTQAAQTIRHAPWLVANLSINQPDQLNGNLSLAWDNVLYDSAGLGYVVANHQDTQRYHDQSVLTYYRALAHSDEHQARQQLYAGTWTSLQTSIVQDLQKAHPELSQHILNMDIWRWGHAMTYPQPGFLTNKARQLLNHAHPQLHIAHTDAAGISIFEEAFAQGVKAAQNILGKNNHSTT